MNREEILKKVWKEWRNKFDDEKVLFSYSPATYSPNYKGKRKEAYIYLRNYNKSLSVEQLKQFCGKLNNNKISIQF